MKYTHFKFTSNDGVDIQAAKWQIKNAAKVKGVVQIAHGMAEHIQRYDRFAQALLDAGYIVYGNDHRGHGKTAGAVANIGYFADKNGWNLVVEDMKELTKILKQENPDLPVFLFGHSMGSFLSRTYIQKYGDDIDGVILCGSGGNPGLLGNIAIFLAKREIKSKGAKVRSKRMDRLFFGNFNKPFAPNRTGFDWLSRDSEEVDKYVADPYCGEVFTAGFFHDMLTGLRALNKIENINKIPKELPVYFIAGDKDPVGKNTKGVLQAYRSFKNAGIKDVSYKFYKNARHELLNETNREEVYTDIIRWLKVLNN